ncbi:hypothetical protein VTN77DRAFT_4141 [Rasamsonia byssochlamydoides]|uniref:uncharacterized protein n=1 Tax=Rasamsonia byssochlamydoides TaxID=89139 RepID=UPI003743E435
MHQFPFPEYPSPVSLCGTPYIVEMSDFISYPAGMALEGDGEMTQCVFSDLALQSSCHQPLMVSEDFISPSNVSGGSHYAHDSYPSLPPYTGSPTVGTYNESTPPPPFSQDYFLEGSMAHPYTMPSSHPYLDADLPQLHQQQQPQLQQQRMSRSPPLRSESPDPGDLTNYGIRNADGTWRCAYPGCSSRTVFTRACDLRKHFNRHNKYLFCRYEGCPQATEGGFSSKKDRARHEAKHNPKIMCEWEGCGRVFSRVDNMKDHVRRIHKRRSQ